MKKIPYYNGLILYNTNVCKKYLNKINNSSFSFLSELLITILNNEKIWDGNIGGVYVPTERAIDIDTELDLRIADLLIQYQKKENITVK